MKTKTFFASVVSIGTLVTFVSLQMGGVIGCFGAGDGGGTGGREVPEDFNELMTTTNDQAATLSTKNSEFVTAYETLAGQAADSSSSLSNLDAAIDDFVSKGDDVVTEYEYYGDLIDAYNEDLGAAALLLGGVDPVFKGQSVDLRTTLALKNQLEAAQQAKKECEELFPGDDEVQQAEQLKCKRDRTIALLKEGGRIGFGLTLAAGGSKIVGAACAAATAPGWVTFGAVVGTGIAVYALWNYCTKPSSSQLSADGKSQESECDCGAINTCESQTKQLKDGRIAATCTFSRGTGTVIVHPPNGTPVVRELTVDDNGFLLDASGCTGSESSASSSEAKGCNDGAQAGDISIADATCSDVGGVTASNSPSDPGPGQSVVVTYCVVPAVSGCSTSYIVSGTDGYSASGTPATDASGCTSFTIPGGAEGVVDTVIVKETTNNLQSTIVYTF